MIYLDNAATTRPQKEALKEAEAAIDNYYNPSALYGGGLEAARAVNKAREEILALMHCERNFELIFTSCGTEADNQIIFSSARRGNFVTTAGEHAAVYECAKELKGRGVEVRFVPIGKDGSVDSNAVLELVDENTSLVSVIHVNNETGAINPVEEIARRVKEKNSRTLFMSDGVQAFGKIAPFLSEEIDFYSVSAHKIGGLKGTGALFKRKGKNLQPYLFGGGQEGGKRSGTENVFGILAFAAAAKRKFASLKEDGERIKSYREVLFDRLDKEIFHRISPLDGSPYILSVAARGLRGEVLLRMLSDRGVYLGTGSACSSKHPHSRVMEACGLEKSLLGGVLRMSFSPENTLKETEEAAAIINETARELHGRMG